MKDKGIGAFLLLLMRSSVLFENTQKSEILLYELSGGGCFDNYISQQLITLCTKILLQGNSKTDWKFSSNVAKQDYCNAIPNTFDHLRGQECKVVVVFLLSKQGSVYSKSVEIF